MVLLSSSSSSCRNILRRALVRCAVGRPHAAAVRSGGAVRHLNLHEYQSAQIMRELFTGASKGFGFLEMPGKAHSLAAINALNGKDFHGQPLRVNEARPRMGRR